MAAKQTATLLGRFVEHQDCFNSLPTAGAQWAIQNPKDAVALCVASIRNRTKEGAQQPDRTRRVLRSVTPTPVNSCAFNAEDTFFNQKSGVRMTTHGTNFQNWFRGKTEEDAPSEMLTPFALERSAYDREIIADLGGEDKAEVTLSEVWRLMRAQANGEKGTLLTNGYANIFYVKDVDVSGILRAVRVGWSDDGWYVCASARGDGRWHDGGRVFSRNS